MKTIDKKYTVQHWCVDKKKKEETLFEHSLLKAREFARGLFRQGRFISLKNKKGVSLPL